jgi:hypothetical protein
MPRQRRRPPLKRSNADRSVPTGGRMHPSMACWGMRGMEDLTVEARARWPQTLDRWIGPRAPQTERTRRRPWVMQPHTAHPA